MKDLATRMKTPRGEITIKIPGGWEARIPEITKMDATTSLSYGRFFQSQGLSSLKAEEAMLESMNKVFERGWKRYLGISIRRWAQVYARKYPEKLKLLWKKGKMETYVLEGFDPERMQYTYIPDARVGRRGKTKANAALAEMAKEGEM